MTSATAYYNEIEPFAAQWLRNLIDAGLIAPGIVDTRSIEDVTPNDLRGFTQCHFFAGIGVWSHALRMAGWADNRPVWTGSCPCQPFSQAGKGAGIDDERHLWPHFHWLIQQCRPVAVFGEQVASQDGLAWIDIVQTDLEGSNYTSGAVDLCSAGVGAPHIRQRLYWMAHANVHQFETSNKGSPESHREDGRNRQGKKAGESAGLGAAGGLEHASGDGRQGWLLGWQDPQRKIIDGQTGRNSTIGRLGDAEGNGSADRQEEPGGRSTVSGAPAKVVRAWDTVTDYHTLQVNGFWRDADWLFCRDGKWRAVEPGTFPLAPGTPGRVGQVRAYGNAITAEVARVFIETYDDFLNDIRRCDPAKAIV